MLLVSVRQSVCLSLSLSLLRRNLFISWGHNVSMLVAVMMKTHKLLLVASFIFPFCVWIILFLRILMSGMKRDNKRLELITRASEHTFIPHPLLLIIMYRISLLFASHHLLFFSIFLEDRLSLSLFFLSLSCFMNYEMPFRVMMMMLLPDVKTKNELLHFLSGGLPSTAIIIIMIIILHPNFMLFLSCRSSSTSWWWCYNLIKGFSLLLLLLLFLSSFLFLSSPN